MSRGGNSNSVTSPQWDQRTRTCLEPEHWNPFRSEESLSRKMLKLPLPHLTVNDQVPKPSNRNQPCQHFCKTTYPPLTHQSSWSPRPGRQIWALPPLCLLANTAIKLFVISKAMIKILASMHFGQQALCLLTLSSNTLWWSKINNITKQLCLSHGKSEK